ncbi:MAG: YfhO family protein [Chitinophagaceae bacterium]|nr:YfhO family protein [Chitinophagaceae bacterium]
MKNLSFKALLPHLVAVTSFVIVAVIYCKPALEGKVLQQSDIIHWKGMAKDIQDYRATHNGVAPLWTTNMFSGMPGYQIAGNNNNYISYYANEIFSLFIPKPFRFFILACLGFYFLCIVLRINPWLGITGAIAYAYASYSPIIISVGHETKMLSMAYVPAVLGGLIMIFDKRYWSGAAFTALFSSILVFHNHYQIVYYFLLIAVFVTAAYVVKWIKEKQYKHMVTAAAFAIVAGLIGVLSNAVTLFTTYDYSKATIRGGQASLNVKDSINATKQKGGLDTGYAFLYGSYGVAETFTLMVPDIYGGGPHPLGEESKLVEVMGEKGLPPQLANQLYSSFPAYWGNQPGHSGPVYLGAVICFLFIFGMAYIKSHHKWWIAVVSLLAIMMSWGKNFAAFNTFIFEYLPMYNKFRAPAMILVITQLTFPLLAVLGVQQFLFGKDDKTYLWKKLKLAGLITTGVFAVLFLLYISFDYKNDRDKFIQQQLTQMSNGDSSLGRDIVNAAADDRKGLFGKDLFRSFFFIGASFLLLFLYARNKLKATPVIIGLLLLSSIDVLAVGKRYLANDNFMEPEDSDGVFLPTPADAEIKKDTEANYRVFNLTQDPFNDAITAYHHKSIGGYHAAKLSIYQDLIENQLSKQPMNMPVLDMLNTKYVITTDSAGRLLPQRNPGALGSAWLVKSISFVKDAKAEMRALDNFNPKESAIVQESFKPSVPFMPQWDSAGTIQLVKNDNDIVTYSFNASTNQFAVFSEVYYDRGWKAFVDGKETPIVKVNYVLRGLSVPAGKHNIEFRFEPSSYKTGKQLTGISQLLILGILITGIFLEYRRSKKPVNKA